MSGETATAHVRVDATRERVWAALTEPDQVQQWMMGARVETDWRVGSPVVWRGDYDGKPFEDHGEVLAADRPERLSVDHYSPLSGQPDEPENHHTLVWTLTEPGDGTGAATELEMTQDGCGSADEAERFSANWQTCLDALKASVEG